MQLHKLINRLQFTHRSIQRESIGRPEDFAKRLNISKRQFYNIKAELMAMAQILSIAESKTHIAMSMILR